MKSRPDRKYTIEFRDSAVRQVIDGGRSCAAGGPLAGDVGQDAGELGGQGPQGRGAGEAPAGVPVDATWLPRMRGCARRTPR